MTAAAEQSENRRRRLLWRASHRGIRELELLLGGFATHAAA
jgi:succinate dehydrogenase flavin-adding protein (antitoxin of CptAB toxin-antitoxin module)